MELFNATRYAASYSPGLMPNGRSCLILVVKATFDIQEDSLDPVLADKQIELFDTDTFVGEPGYSSPIYENDYATYKPKCDVLIFGKAHTLNHQPQTSVNVAVKVANIRKSFRVIGKRTWNKSGPFLYATDPEKFTEQELNWEVAYGGIDLAYQREKDKI
jgi:hypothetical protein